MSTFVFELVDALENRWKEVDILIDKAKQEVANEGLFNALCRSSIVLITAHFEGFLKDCAKAILDDLNAFSSFEKTPTAIKRTFCKLFTGIGDKENDKACEKRIQKLMDTFDGLETKFIVDPFLFEDNKNPSPSVVEKICKNFGIKNFFAQLDNSLLDTPFKGSQTDTEKLLNQLRQHVLEGVRCCPYTLTPAQFEIDESAAKKQERTFWETFLDQLLESRHSIAHGTSLNNGCSLEDIIDFEKKIQILQYVFIMILCTNATMVGTKIGDT